MDLSVELTPEQKGALEEFRSQEPWMNLDERNSKGTIPRDEEVEIESNSFPPPLSINEFDKKSVTPSADSSKSDLEYAPPHELDVDESYWSQYFRNFCNDHCLLRYLRAHQWNIDRAFKALRETLRWRRKYKPHLIDPADLSEEARTGKEYLNGYDKFGRPILYLRNHRENTKNHGAQIRLLIFNLETAIKLMPSGVEKIVLIFDFQHYSASNSPPIHVSKYFLHVLASHYPERLGMMFACNAPWYFWIFYKLIAPFIHPVTKAKIRFVEVKSMKKIKLEDEGGQWANLLNYIDINMLEEDFGGELNFEYRHEVYWPHLCEVCENKVPM